MDTAFDKLDDNPPPPQSQTQGDDDDGVCQLGDTTSRLSLTNLSQTKTPKRIDDFDGGVATGSSAQGKKKNSSEPRFDAATSLPPTLRGTQGDMKKKKGIRRIKKPRKKSNVSSFSAKFPMSPQGGASPLSKKPQNIQSELGSPYEDVPNVTKPPAQSASPLLKDISVSQSSKGAAEAVGPPRSNAATPLSPTADNPLALPLADTGSTYTSTPPTVTISTAVAMPTTDTPTCAHEQDKGGSHADTTSSSSATDVPTCTVTVSEDQLERLRRQNAELVRRQSEVEEDMIRVRLQLQKIRAAMDKSWRTEIERIRSEASEQHKKEMKERMAELKKQKRFLETIRQRKEDEEKQSETSFRQKGIGTRRVTAAVDVAGCTKIGQNKEIKAELARRDKQVETQQKQVEAQQKQIARQDKEIETLKAELTLARRDELVETQQVQIAQLKDALESKETKIIANLEVQVQALQVVISEKKKLHDHSKDQSRIVLGLKKELRIKRDSSEKLQQENRQLEDAHKGLRDWFDRLKSKKSKHNVVIYGIGESPEGTGKHDRHANDLESISTITQVLDPSITRASIRDYVRLGKYESSRTRPILVKFNSMHEASSILANSHKLRDYPGISIEPQLSSTERAIKQVLLKQRYELIQSGIDKASIRLRGSVLFVDGVEQGRVICSEYVPANTHSTCTSPEHTL